MPKNISMILSMVNFLFLALALLAAFHYAFRLKYELKRSEVLREIAHRYQAFVDSTSEGIFRCNMSGHVIIMNHAGARLLGYQDASDFFHGEEGGFHFYENLTLHDEKKSQLLKNDMLDKTIVILKRKGGTTFFAEVTANVMKNDQGEAFGVEGIFRDVTERIELEKSLKEYREHLEDMVRQRTAELEASNMELAKEIEIRKKTEVDLRFSEETARALLNAPLDMAMLVDKRGKILSANAAASQALGREVSDLIGLNLYAFLNPELQEKYRALGRQTVRTKCSVRSEDEVEGSVYSTAIYPILNEEKHVERSAIFTSDITKRRQAEMVLKEYHEHLEELVAERTKEIVTMNDQLRNELVKRRNAEIALKEYSETLEDRVQSATNEILKLERREFQLEKLAAIGQVTSTVVHEIRNPLSSIKMGLTTLMSRVKLEERDQRCLDVAKREVIHLESMLRDILDYGKPQNFQFVSQDLNLVIRMTLDSLVDELKQSHIQIVMELSKTLPPVQVDSERYNQVLRNLVLNAAQAMPDGGKVSIRTAYIEADNNVEIVVEDNGHGMEADTVSHIFEPFFSTKAGGTGLGLPIVEKIMTAHNGTIKVNSVWEKGTTIRMTLPV